MNFDDSLLIEIVHGAISLIIVMLGWVVGQRILVSWDIRKKRQELDLVSSSKFDNLYGEFKEVSKLWRIVQQKLRGSIKYPEYTRWELLSRACAAESKNEALLVKLATERNLSEEEIASLAVFRQAFQRLRESIRDDTVVPSSSRGPEYLLFNSLAASVAAIIRMQHRVSDLSAATASANLHAIARVTLSKYEEAVADYIATHPDLCSVADADTVRMSPLARSEEDVDGAPDSGA